MKKSVSIESKSVIAGLLVVLTTILPGGAVVFRVPDQYPTIQGAVNAAASGDTIRIAAGVYEEQVVIAGKNLRLAGAPGAVLKAKPGLIETLLPLNPEAVNLRPLLAVVFTDDVVVQGLTVDGARLGAVNEGMLGVLFHSTSGRLERCTIRGFRGDPGLDFGLGFAAGNFANPGRPVQHVRVLNNDFQDNSISIEMSGDDGSNPAPLHLEFAIQNNCITGVGPTDQGTQEGIRIHTGASGDVRGNAISEHSSIGPAFTFSFGVNAQDFFGNLTPLQPVRYEGNTFRNNQVHLFAVVANDSQIMNNTFKGSSTGTRSGGIGASGDNLRIINNDFLDLPLGIILIGDDPDFGTALGITTNAKLIDNRFCHVTTPIVVEPLVTGVTERGTKIGCERNAHEHDGDDDHDEHSREDNHNH